MQYIASRLMDLFDLHAEVREKLTASAADWRRFLKAAYDPSI